jgi:hypothetical protein
MAANQSILSWEVDAGGDKVKPQNAELLTSWKEIAAYVGKGIRTVQRWEVELDLPIRRTHGKAPKAGVMAMRTEIDAWLQARQIGGDAHVSDRVKGLLRSVAELQLEVQDLRRQLAEREKH